MANGGNFPFVPRDPENIVLRPLSSGVQLHLPPQGLPIGAFLEAKNLSVNPSGLTRRPVYRTYGRDLGSAPYGPFVDFQKFWTTEGEEEPIIWDQKFIYTVAPTVMTGGYWVYSIGTITVDAGVTVTGDGTLWDTAASEVQVGDIMILDPEGVGDGPEEIEIASIDTDTSLDLATACTGTYAGADYEIRRAFSPETPLLVDFAVVPGTTNKMLFADGSRFLYSYDGTDFEDFNSAEDAIIPRCVAYFQNRVWIGNLVEATVEYRQRIRWSRTFPNVSDFGSGGVAGYGYQDLPYQQGELIRLVPMGLYLAAYFRDRIFLGRPSNVYGLPLQFDPIETGRIGLVGVKAVIPWIGGHFFVGQDNIYWVTPQGMDPEGIATPIMKESIRSCYNPWRIYAVHHPPLDSLLFAFPQEGEGFKKIWLFNYKSKSWSEWPISGEMLSVGSVPDILTYGTWVDDTPESGTGSGTAAGTTFSRVTGDGFTTITWLVAGDYLHITDEDDDGDEEVTTYTVASVTNDDALEIAETFAATFVGKTYQLVPQGSTYAALSVYDSYGTIQPAILGEQTLYLGTGDILHYFQTAGSYDQGGAGPGVQLTTGDLDLDLPDTKKVWTRVSLKLEDYVTSEVLFNAYVSVNRGRTWKSIGNLYIREDGDEGFLTFRTIGSMARFKFVSGSQVEPYTINEIIVRARPMGTDIPGRTS